MNAQHSETSEPNGTATSAKLPTTAMLGVGNMSGAILDGLVRDPAAPDAPIRATHRSTASADRRADAPKVEALALERDPDANRRAVAGAGLVILGVKPAMISGLLADIRDELDPGAVVISVAAGVTIATIEAGLAAGTRVVRAMPNTPSQIGLGVAGIAPGTHADEDAMRMARAVFGAVGEVVECPEAQLPAIGAISGSGPAHVFLIAEELMRIAASYGFDDDDARTLAVGTLRGSSELLHASPEVPAAELRRRVTSPKGTTERSVAALQDGGLGELLARAIAANIARSDELAAETGGAAEPDRTA